jgi:hypothetical protein
MNYQPTDLPLPQSRGTRVLAPLEILYIFADLAASCVKALLGFLKFWEYKSFFHFKGK